MIVRLGKPALLGLVLLTACAQRPPWADGRIVWERAPKHPVVQDFSHFEDRILAVHNRERALVGARPLVWDPALAAAAKAYGPAPAPTRSARPPRVAFARRLRAG